MKELISGWTVDQTIMHFDHIAVDEAEALLERGDDLHVVVTINSTYAESKTMLHHNKYFAMSFASALGLATQLELSFLSGGIAERVVAIRPATDEGGDAYWAAYEHFNATVEAIAD